MLALAKLYSQLDNGMYDYDKAVYWLTRIAEEGDPKIQKLVAGLYANGESDREDPQKAFYWYSRAAEQGDEEAMLSLSVFYQTGYGTEVDNAKAEYWQNKAAGSNGESDEDSEKIQHDIDIDDDEEAFLSEVDDMIEAYESYDEGYKYYQDEDYEKAVKCYTRSAELGNPEAMVALVELYSQPEYEMFDVDKAIYWMEQLAEEGDADTQRTVAEFYSNEEFQREDPEKAFYWYSRAAEQGDEEAIHALGTCYRDGYGVKQDLSKAREWYAKICCEDELDDCRQSTDEKSSREDQPAKKESASGTGGNVPNASSSDLDSQVFDIFTKAAEQGDGNAMNRLGLSYEFGLGTDKNFAKAVYWYTRAAGQGCDEAKENLKRLGLE